MLREQVTYITFVFGHAVNLILDVNVIEQASRINERLETYDGARVARHLCLVDRHWRSISQRLLVVEREVPIRQSSSENQYMWIHCDRTRRT